MCSDNVRNFNYSNYHTELVNKILVRNEILITLTFYYKLISTRDDGFCYIGACGEGFDETACMHDLARAFASRIYKECKLKKTPNNF